MILEIHIKEINNTNGINNYYFEKLIEANILENKTILIDEKNYEN